MNFFPGTDSSPTDGDKDMHEFRLPTDSGLEDSPIDAFNPRQYPSSPLPRPPELQARRLDKSLSPSPSPLSAAPDLDDLKSGIHARSASNPTLPASNNRNLRRRPLILDDQSSLQRLSALIQAHDIKEPDLLASPDIESPTDPTPPQALPLPRPGKIKQLTGDDDAQAFHNAKLAQANLPWYLRPKYSDDEIKLEYDGSVKAGTLPALVERLVIDPLRKTCSARHKTCARSDANSDVSCRALTTGNIQTRFSHHVQDFRFRQ